MLGQHVIQPYNAAGGGTMDRFPLRDLPYDDPANPETEVVTCVMVWRMASVQFLTLRGLFELSDLDSVPSTAVVREWVFEGTPAKGVPFPGNEQVWWGVRWGTPRRPCVFAYCHAGVAGFAGAFEPVAVPGPKPCASGVSRRAGKAAQVPVFQQYTHHRTAASVPRTVRGGRRVLVHDNASCVCGRCGVLRCLLCWRRYQPCTFLTVRVSVTDGLLCPVVHGVTRS